MVRDTSMSMQGLWNHWTSMLCQNVVDLARKNRMRIGYIEFNTGAEKFVDAETRTFFTRNYDGLHRRMGEVACEGLTNYEQPPPR